MKTATRIDQVREAVSQWKSQGKSIGLVPTMGYLHRGHGSLVKKAAEENDVVIVSNFVNPTQFGKNEDLNSYPRDLDADYKLCESLGADLMFCPQPQEMYDNPLAFVNIDLLSQWLCGKSRPVHFRGVCTVVTKLFNITKADRAYFGEKDAQQLLIIKKMVKDLNFDVEVVGCPIVREADGLAMSSRNAYLNEQERKAAKCLSKSIELGKSKIKKGMIAQELKDYMKEAIEREPLAEIDYLEVVDLNTLQPVDRIDESVLVAMAVNFDKARLLDNFMFHV
ncbi:MAG: pantoate--beta-alanine ligase [[Eubacterium] brachy]|nr:pantoate--beta-alanine ligase [[Eubacterium] brachy]